MNVIRSLHNLLLLTAFLATGCTLTGSNGNPFSAEHRLSPQANALRLMQTAPAPLPTEMNKVTLPEYILEPGDVLLVEPVYFDSPLRLPADQTILADGTIDLGLYGRVHVAGQPVELAEARVQVIIHDVYRTTRRETDPEDPGPVNLRLVGPQSKTYFVLGEVVSPGELPYIGRETVLSGVMAAGGLTPNAAVEKIILVRPTPPVSCRKVLAICWLDITQLGDTSTNYQLMPGDRIYVPSRKMIERIFEHKKEESPVCLGCHDLCLDIYGVAPSLVLPEPPMTVKQPTPKLLTPITVHDE